MKKRLCLECEEGLRGRSDKKYCSDYCRSTAYNRRNTDSRLMKRIHAILKKNRYILNSYINNHETKIGFDRLIFDGFRPNYFTHQVKIGGGRTTLFYCYDIGYEIDSLNGLRIAQN